MIGYPSNQSLSGEGTWQAKLPLVFHGLSGIVAVYFVVLVVTTPMYVRQKMQGKTDGSSAGIQSLPPLSSLDQYLNTVSSNPLFGKVEEKVKARARSACDEFQSSHVLSGIITGGQNEALFKSKSGKRTFFVQPGEMIGDVTILDVTSQSVLISCSDKQIEIMMEGS